MFVIQQIFDHDMQHLHPKFFLNKIYFSLKNIKNEVFTLPLFNSSNDVGISEYSRGAPYKLIQLGPKVGKKPFEKQKFSN